MAHRFITQAAVTAARVFGRAFAEAYRQANASSAYKRTGASGAAGGAGEGGGGGGSFTGLTLSEACRILNIAPPSPSITRSAATAATAAEEHTVYLTNVTERFKKLFDLNDPNKGGSFYLQSKVLRARERLESEVGSKAEREAEEASRKMPRVYKER